MQEKIIIIDFGSQYTQLIGRRVRELNVYSEIHPYNKLPEFDEAVKGVILSGSPFSVLDELAPQFNFDLMKGNIPLLGLCYGAQYMSHTFGGNVAPSNTREYGRANLNFVDNTNVLMKDVPMNSQVWMSHGDTINTIPENFQLIASTPDVKVAAFQLKNEQTFGIQFHPEVYHSTDGLQLLKNFIVDVCACDQSWTPDAFAETTIEKLKNQIGNDKVVL